MYELRSVFVLAVVKPVARSLTCLREVAWLTSYRRPKSGRCCLRRMLWVSLLFFFEISQLVENLVEQLLAFVLNLGRLNHSNLPFFVNEIRSAC